MDCLLLSLFFPVYFIFSTFRWHNPTRYSDENLHLAFTNFFWVTPSIYLTIAPDPAGFPCCCLSSWGVQKVQRAV